MVNHVLVVHLLAATVWTGGHLILALAILPKVLIKKDVAGLLEFEEKFEKIGMPALFVQVVTGLWMAHNLLPVFSMWFLLDNDLSILITLKIALLSLTVIIALHARFRVIPKLSTEKLSTKTLNWFAAHIIAITILSVGFVIVGSLFRTGLG